MLLLRETSGIKPHKRMTGPEMARHENRLTKDGAESLARKIRRYWASKGRVVDVWVETMPSPDNIGGAVHIVRSNLINGVPV